MIKMETDVAVVAMGLGGLAAAISAAENGARVVGFEKMRVTGGSANMGMGPFAVESRVQKRQLINLTREEAFMQHMEYTHWTVDARLVHDYFWRTADTIDWLMDMGVEFIVQPYFPKAKWTAHNVIPEGGGKPGPRAGGTMCKRMTERAEQLGVQIMLETPVKRLIKEDGKIVGLIAQNADGEEIECRAKAVIIATGGIGDNEEMLRELTGVTPDMYENFAGVPGLKGDGLRMAWEVGAGRTPIHAEFGVGIHDNFNHWILEASYRGKPELMVNLDGERFFNEEMNEMGTFAGNAIRRQKGHIAFEIMDQKRLNYLKKHGPEVIDEVHGHDFYEHFDEAAAAAVEEGYPDFFVADTIEELCEKTGINYENLVRTLDEYNKACETGRDTVLSKNVRFLNPVKTPKFYCQKMILQSTGVKGGILINRHGEVLTESGDVLPGLYAAGTDANSIYGECYNFYLPGNNMGFALNMGRVCGESANEYINSMY